MKTFKKSHLAALAVSIAAITAGATLLDDRSDAHAETTANLPVVTYQSAQQRPVSDEQQYTGRLEAVDVVDVRPRVAGTLLTVHFKAGQHVRQGDLLFSIDPAPYETQVRQAQANLAGIEERGRLARIEQARTGRLLESNAVSRRDFDSRDNAVREAAAALKGAEAALAQAQLQLGYTQVRAPISGRISRAEITAGNVLGAGGDSAPLTRIVSDDKLYASFNLDEQSYLKIIAPSLRTGAQALIDVGLANDDGFPYPAVIESLDNRMDTRSGTVRVRALIKQVSPEMLPGLQARIRLQSGAPYTAVTVDDALVGTDQDRKYLLVINAQNKVERRFVELGALQGRERVVRSGIEPGSRVVVDGAFRAPPGTEVAPVSAKASTASASEAPGGES